MHYCAYIQYCYLTLCVIAAPHRFLPATVWRGHRCDTHTCLRSPSFSRLFSTFYINSCIEKKTAWNIQGVIAPKYLFIDWTQTPSECNCCKYQLYMRLQLRCFCQTRCVRQCLWTQMYFWFPSGLDFSCRCLLTLKEGQQHKALSLYVASTDVRGRMCSTLQIKLGVSFSGN